MSQTRPPPGSNIIIIKIWRDYFPNKTRWRGKIEHHQSGKSTSFLRLDEIPGFIRSLGLMMERDTEDLTQEQEDNQYNN